MKTPWRDGTSHVVMSDGELLEKLAAWVVPVDQSFHLCEISVWHRQAQGRGLLEQFSSSLTTWDVLPPGVLSDTPYDRWKVAPSDRRPNAATIATDFPASLFLSVLVLCRQS